MARPTDYNEELVSSICEQLADGFSLRQICLSESMPNRATVFRWLAKYEEFSDQYARAKEEAAELFAEDIISIADGEEDGDVQRDRLRVDARKWVASKLKPKKYGDKVQQEITGANGGPIKTEWLIQPVKPVETNHG